MICARKVVPQVKADPATNDNHNNLGRNDRHERIFSSYTYLLLQYLLLSMILFSPAGCSALQQEQSVATVLDLELEQARVFTPVTQAAEVRWDTFMKIIAPGDSEVLEKLFRIPFNHTHKIESGVVGALKEHKIELGSLYVSVSQLGETDTYLFVLHDLGGIGYYRALYDKAQGTATSSASFEFLEGYDETKFNQLVDDYVRLHKTWDDAKNDNNHTRSPMYPFWNWQPVLYVSEGGDLVD